MKKDPHVNPPSGLENLLVLLTWMVFTLVGFALVGCLYVLVSAILNNL